MKYLPLAMLALAASFSTVSIADSAMQSNFLELQQQMQQLKQENNKQLTQLKSSLEAQIAQLQQQIKALGVLNKESVANLKANFDAQITAVKRISQSQITELKQQLDTALSQKK